MVDKGRGHVFQLLAAISRHDLALRQLPAFATSVLIASLFYRFGSFALECLAFLATWFVLDAAVQLLAGRPERMADRTGAPPPDG
jgi:hypothetical protein